MKNLLYALVATIAVCLGIGSVNAEGMVPLEVKASFDDKANYTTFTPEGYDYGATQVGGYYKEKMTIPESHNDFINFEVTLGKNGNVSPDIAKFTVSVQTNTVVSEYDFTPILTKDVNGVYTANFKIPASKLTTNNDGYYDGISFVFKRSNGTERLFKLYTDEYKGTTDYTRFAGKFVNDKNETIVIKNDGTIIYKDEKASNNSYSLGIYYDENLNLVKEEITLSSYNANHYLLIENDNTLSVLDKENGTKTGEVFKRHIPVTDFTFNQDIFNLKKGNTANIEITINPTNATSTEANYLSEDENIVTVSQNGVITAKGVGTTYINVIIDGITKKIKVTVSVPNTDNINSNIEQDINNAIKDQNQNNIDVNFNNDNNKVSEDVFNNLKNTDKTLTFTKQDNNGNLLYSWSFQGNNISNTSDLNLDLNKSITTNTELNKLLENMQKVSNALYLNFKHHGTLPGIATLNIYVGDIYQDGTILYLYYYNEQTNNIELINDKIVVQNGIITFDIDHCSTYFTTTNILTEKEVTNIENPKTNDNLYQIICILLTSLAGITISLKKLL